METGILTQLMQSFVTTFNQGGARLVPEALVLLGSIAVIELLLIGIWWSWGEGGGITSVIAKLLGIAFLAILIRQWNVLTGHLIHGFMYLGLLAGGDAISITDFTDTGNLAGYGFTVTGNLFSRLMSYSGWDAAWHLPEIIIASPIGLMIVLIYFGYALNVFIALIEFYAYAAITTILLPFAANSKVAFLAEKAIAAIFAAALKVFVLAYIASATFPILQAQAPGLNPTWKTMLVQLLGAMAMACLAWRANKLAQGLLYGAPQLSIADAARFVQTTMTTLTMVGKTAMIPRAASMATRRTICVALTTGMLLTGCMSSLMSTGPQTQTITVSQPADQAYVRALHTMHGMGGRVTSQDSRTRSLSAEVHRAVILNVLVTPAGPGSRVTVTGSLLPNKLVVGSFDEVDVYLQRYQEGHP